MSTEPFQPGDIYEDCALHPVICETCNEEDDEITGVSMLDGSRPRCCSLFHCGVRPLTPEEAQASIDAWKKDGERGLMRLAGWNEEAIDEFMKNWRT